MVQLKWQDCRLALKGLSTPIPGPPKENILPITPTTVMMFLFQLTPFKTRGLECYPKKCK